MKFLPALLLLAACATCTPPAPPLEQAQRAVQLFDGAGSGTAWPLSCEREPAGTYLVQYVTAAHVARVAPLRIKGLHWVGTRRHPTLDVVVASFRSPTYVLPLRLRRTPVAIGARVWHSGFPLNEWTFTEGFVTGPRRATTQVAPGSSGGPILDAAGRVVGMVTHMRNSPYGPVYHRAVMVPVSALREWLNAPASP